ncbi:excalibur calcium-binding domain-containing protein [Actinokineospora diospyrosa]|uniref:Excalibur calcium-binding domain-containing protein n=1 Tax=Actinokineospora diospyrosa TaxID=103728 RepID=A0ABT1IN70_9PSEU|nr:excalibur calcium-binding domain-containing protein [Actinokineospora diospyrosa]MCP2274123.1 Excalibur calcium-binding domain-containing protein [Actinokineospora diospyrosa]
MDAVAWWRNRKRKWLWVVGASLLGLFVIAAIAGDPNRGQRQAAAAPTTTIVAQDLITLPTDLVGKNAAQAKTTLQELGFTAVDYQSVDGRTVMVAENWTVVAVESAAAAVARTDRIILRVDKPQPVTTQPTTTTATTATTTTEAPPVTAAPAPPPVADPPPAEPEATEQAPANVYYKNCDAARAAGAAPIHVGEPGYRIALDRNKDGVACEN